MAGLRDRIAHGYASVDPARPWSEIPDGLGALERYATAVARLVDNTGSTSPSGPGSQTTLDPTRRLRDVASAVRRAAVFVGAVLGLKIVFHRYAIFV